MSAGNDINIAANLISGAKVSPVSGTLMTTVHHPPPHRAAASAPAVTWRWLQGHNLDVTASSVSAGHSALLSAGNDLSLNAVRESKNSRNGRSESHESHAASTVTAGDNFLLVAGRDIASQAAGMGCGK